GLRALPQLSDPGATPESRCRADQLFDSHASPAEEIHWLPAPLTTVDTTALVAPDWKKINICRDNKTRLAARESNDNSHRTRITAGI
ncbi:hypothetical protein FDECE_18645, partial [Fusarium decemcellulare]